MVRYIFLKRGFQTMIALQSTLGYGYGVGRVRKPTYDGCLFVECRSKADKKREDGFSRASCNGNSVGGICQRSVDDYFMVLPAIVNFPLHLHWQ